MDGRVGTREEGIYSVYGAMMGMEKDGEDGLLIDEGGGLASSPINDRDAGAQTSK